MLYIKALAAPFTVNTMPEGTLKALADHGELGPIMAADGGDCEAVLAQFAKAGIDVDALAAQLQDEGAKSFVKSWNELMDGDRVEERRAEAGCLRIKGSIYEGIGCRCWRDPRQDSCHRAAGTPRKFRIRSHADSPDNGWPGSGSSRPGWKYDVVAIGYPGPVLHNRPVADPHNLAKGWIAFDYRAAFKRPVKLINDAAMQALGSYRRGKLLFLGLGTGLGSAMIVDGRLEPMELGHLPYKKATYEDYVGLRGLEKHGKKKWRKHVADVVELLIAALEPDDVVLGGGNVQEAERLALAVPLCLSAT